VLEINRKHLLAAMRSGRHFSAIEFAKATPLTRLAGSSDKWLKPFLPPFQRSKIEYPDGTCSDSDPLSIFERESAAARERLRVSRPRDRQVVIKRSELEAAITEGLAELASLPDADVSARQRSSLRHGLQMYGLHVRKDNKLDKSPLRLANADLAFSLRFIACSFEMPISLSSASLVTLDLSGCAVPGIDATFLKLSGSLRLRRLYSSAPLDFTGTRIHGFLDGADMVLQPFGAHPPSQAVSPERAMLGLNQAQIDNEIRLQRAQIWGGLTMRGLEAKRSIYMSDAVLLAPLAVLEAMAKAKQRSDPLTAANDTVYDLPGKGEHNRSRKNWEKWQQETWSRGWSDEFKQAQEEFDCTQKGARWVASAAWQGLTLHALLTSNLRARTSAIRADAMKVAGSVFMERVVCHGRTRFKYAHIDGGLTLAGARLRSTEALMPTFDKIALTQSNEDWVEMAKKIHAYRRETYEALIDEEDRGTGELARGSDTYALDLRECRIEGDVRIGIVDGKVDKVAGWSTLIDGDVTFDQAQFGGKLLLERVVYSWKQRVPEADSPSPQGAYDDLVETERRQRETKLKNDDIRQLSARGLTTADTINLCGCENLKGANFSNAFIGGDLLFWADGDPSEEENPQTPPPVPCRTRLRVQQPAQGLHGAVINLAGAHIGGDLRLLFEPGAIEPECGAAEPLLGPAIKAERVTVKGLLSIMPSGNDVNADASTYRDIVNRAHKERSKQREWAARGREIWQEEIAKREELLPDIDLANASATLLEFPPAAWPRAGQMLISGFIYQRALPQGPLAPQPYDTKGPLPETWQAKRMWWLGFGQSLILSAALVFFIFCIFGRSPKEFFGSSYFFLSGWLLLSAVYIFVPLRTRPFAAQSFPMATAWLALQRSHRNPYRTDHSFGSMFVWEKSKRRGNLFRSLAPYTVAADALRREGRWVSASLVEQERLRVRNWQLSWRLHLLQKFSFNLADWMTEYGYNYARLLFCAGLTVIFAAMTVESAKDAGAVMPKDQVPPAVRIEAGSVGDAIVLAAVGTKNNGTRLDNLLYAVDTVLPVLDLGERAEWSVDHEVPALNASLQPWFGRSLTYARLLALYRFIGLILAGVLLLGLSTRFSQWLTRYGD
jgi:hypothetical protein